MSTTHFEMIGGETKVRALVDRFYDLMETKPEAAAILALHPPDLQSSREKLFLFLVGWLGGPPLYVQKYGHPRLRARHMPFPIGESERDQWLLCMKQALDEVVELEHLRLHLYQAFMSLADFMRNKEGRTREG